MNNYVSLIVLSITNSFSPLKNYMFIKLLISNLFLLSNTNLNQNSKLQAILKYQKKNIVINNNNL